MWTHWKFLGKFIYELIAEGIMEKGEGEMSNEPWQRPLNNYETLFGPFPAYHSDIYVTSYVTTFAIKIVYWKLFTRGIFYKVDPRIPNFSNPNVIIIPLSGLLFV